MIRQLRKALEDGRSFDRVLRAGGEVIHARDSLAASSELELDEFQIPQLAAAKQAALRCQHFVDGLSNFNSANRLEAHPAPGRIG